ncbi:MAG: DNA-binding domain-containing protein [Luteibacter sp.]
MLAPTVGPGTVPLAELQRAFQGDLLRSEPRSPLAGQRGFAVHRSTVAQAAIDALEANYPAVVCLVGIEWFRSAAAVYAAECPARDARLLLYGAGFADFLAEAPAARDLPYLADVARLDRLWIESYIAADIAPLSATSVRDLDADALGGLFVVPHPATRASASASPAFAIWDASRAGHPVAGDLAWEPQATLMTRPVHTVLVATTDAPTLTFLDACRAGATLAACVEHVTRSHPAARVDLLFAQLLTAGALTLAQE